MKLLLIALCCFALAGCVSTVAPGGAYNNDTFLYNAESSVTTAYQTFDALLKFEYDNRAALSSTPEVKQYADYVRLNAPKWKITFEELDATYKVNPTAENKDKVQNILNLVKTVLAQSTIYLATPVKPKP